MARPLVPDTTVFVKALRQTRSLPTLRAQFRSGDTWLSSVVATELLAGTRTREELQMLQAVFAAVASIPPEGRLLTPTHQDWVLAGRLLERRGRLFGAIQPRDHLADVLILVSAARIGGEVVTANIRHFQAWTTLARAGGLDVTVSEG